ncbi:MAG: primosomal protein N' [Candidatus Omnitrophica bacterium]|nr:primosomal protein N' [Candidatus Omnitrophota bacterium]MDD5137943.1 primosomal protein N' [Candidatus Omnitrophota bacterium]MDD5538031.1 primosomal protein N' [Candidatus Omnitrophota bacterium]
MKQIAEVAIPVSLALNETFDYRVPRHCRAHLAVGCRVQVPFGHRQLIGYVTAFKSASRYERKLKALSDCLDPQGPLLNERLMSLARFLSREYFCSLAQGFETVLPRPLRIATRHIAAAEPDETASSLDPLTEEEKASLDRLEPGQATYVIEDMSGGERWKIYRALIKSTLAQGRDVLVLVPDYAMIAYAREQLKTGVPECVVSSHERPAVVRNSWLKAQKNAGVLVIGTRSAVFSPVHNPGLIIIDHEGHFAYRQQQVPNYHIRDIALKIARDCASKLVFGAFVPSLEAFALVERHEASLLRCGSPQATPRITMVDMQQEYVPKGHTKMISKVLEFRLAELLEKKERMLLFVPQKGFSTFLYCPRCKKAVECERCSSPVSYYRTIKRFVCPACHLEQEARDICPRCSGAYVRYSGFGTEKVESELRRLFPSVRIAQFSKTADPVESYDIMLATQEILEDPNIFRHCFDRVVLIAADLMLGRPDFRATEHAFSRFLILSRIAKVELIIQTKMPEHYVWGFLKTQDSAGFLKKEFEERRELRLPPVVRLGTLTIRARTELAILAAAKKALRAVKTSLKRHNADAEVFDPQPARPFKLRGYFRYQMLIKYKELGKMEKTLRRLVCDRPSGVITTFDPARE